MDRIDPHFFDLCVWLFLFEVILLMEEILHQLGCIKPVNNWIDYLSTGAGFLPSTVISPKALKLSGMVSSTISITVTVIRI